MDELRRELTALTKWRNETVAHCERVVKAANSKFDREALRIGRQMAKLAAEQEPQMPTATTKPTERTKRTITISVEDGYTQEEVEHFNSLRRKG